MPAKQDDIAFRNWRCPVAYGSMLQLDYPAWAGQCLWRVPAFAAPLSSQATTPPLIVKPAPNLSVIRLDRDGPLQPWGLHFVTAPRADLASSLVMWRSDFDPAVVAAQVVPARDTDHDALDVSRLAKPVLVATDEPGREYLLIGDGTGQIRLDIRGGTVLEGPVRLNYDLEGASAVAAKLQAVQRLLALMRKGRWPRRLSRISGWARRWMMALRTFDGCADGASQREIAAALFGAAVAERDWDGPSTYLRSRMRRLVNLGKALVYGGYRDLLK